MLMHQALFRHAQMEKLRQAHAKDKKEALAEFRVFKRNARDREESIQVRACVALYFARAQ